MGMDASGDADVGAAQQFLDHDEIAVMPQEQGTGDPMTPTQGSGASWMR